MLALPAMPEQALLSAGASRQEAPEERSPLPPPCKWLDEETARELMISYVAGTCASTAKRDFETHCLICHGCRSMLALLLHVLYSPVNEEALASLGIEAAKIAYWLLETEIEASVNT